MTEGKGAGKYQYEVLSPAIFCNEIPCLITSWYKLCNEYSVATQRHRLCIKVPQKSDRGTVHG